MTNIIGYHLILLGVGALLSGLQGHVFFGRCLRHLRAPVVGKRAHDHQPHLEPLP